MKSTYKITFIFLSFTLLFGCVPAKKYEELQTKYNSCVDETANLKGLNKDLTEKNDELTASFANLEKELASLMADTTALGISMRETYAECEQLTEAYHELQDRTNKMIAGSDVARRKLVKELEITRGELKLKQDALKAKTAELAEREKRVNELEAMISRKDALVTALKDKVRAALLGFENKGLTIQQKNGKVYVSLDESLLFASGSYSVGAKGIDVLKKLAVVLEQSQDINIVVEGHTDNVDYAWNGKADIEDNWDLSVKRATSVVKIITNNSKVNPKRLTAAGRGEFLPLDLSDTREGRTKNRRIEIILTPKLDELFELLESN